MNLPLNIGCGALPMIAPNLPQIPRNHNTPDSSELPESQSQQGNPESQQLINSCSSNPNSQPKSKKQRKREAREARKREAKAKRLNRQVSDLPLISHVGGDYFAINLSLLSKPQLEAFIDGLSDAEALALAEQLQGGLL